MSVNLFISLKVFRFINMCVNLFISLKVFKFINIYGLNFNIIYLHILKTRAIQVDIDIPNIAK